MVSKFPITCARGCDTTALERVSESFERELVEVLFNERCKMIVY